MKSLLRLTLIALLILTALCPYCFADAGWMMTTADFRQQTVSLDAITPQGVRVSIAGGGQSNVNIPFDDFLQLDRTAAPRGPQGPFTLHLHTGDRIAGEPTGFENEQLVWKNAAVGELRISLKAIRTLARGNGGGGGGDGGGGAPADGRTDDLVLMNNGDSVKGIITNITTDTVTVEGDATVEVPFGSVAVIHFAETGKAPPGADRAFRLRLADGSSITGPQVASDGAKVTLTLADKTTRQLPLATISGIEQLNGPVSWLSSREPAQVVQLPYFGALSWPTRMDLSVGGRPLTFAGRIYARGIGVHAYSRLDYALDGSHEAFRTQYAIAQEEKRQFADVTVRLKVDGKTVHEQVHVKADAISPVVVIDLPKNAKMLTLEVDYGDANDTQDRFNWIEPALLKKKPAVTEGAQTRPATRPG